MISTELSIKLAQSTNPDAEKNVVMRSANDIFCANNDNWQTPFSQVDIEFATYIDWVKANCSQREIDLIKISEKLTRVWMTLHITMQAMGEHPNDYDQEEIVSLVKSLSRLGLMHLLTDNLRHDLVSWLVGISE